MTFPTYSAFEFWYNYVVIYVAVYATNTSYTVNVSFESCLYEYMIYLFGSAYVHPAISIC